MLAGRKTSSSQMYQYCLQAKKTPTAGLTLVGGGKGRKRVHNLNNARSEFMVVLNFLF